MRKQDFTLYSCIFMKPKIFFFLPLILLMVFSTSEAQDAQFSQYYAAPLYLNPAMAGTTYNTRAVVNYRNQWPGIGKPFVSYAASIDRFFGGFNSGAGLLITQSKEGTSRLRSTEINLIYSYHLDLTENISFIPALQAGYVLRDVDYSRLTFPDQFDNGGPTGATTSDVFDDNRVSYMDFSTGGLVFSEMFWFGASFNHLNRPSQSFISTESNRLPVKANFHTGVKIPLGDQKGRSTQFEYPERAIIPTMLYKSQGKFDQLDAGIYMLWEPVMVGAWYRGLPVKRFDKGIPNRESIVALAGFMYKNFNFGYSYDFTISTLTLKSKGAHEISLTYVFGEEQDKTYKTKSYKRRLPCPSFYKRRLF